MVIFLSRKPGQVSSAVLALVLLFSGCGPEGLKTFPVTGTVKYEDGAVPQAQFATITFQPAPESTSTKGASGKIEADGSFKLLTIDPGDGAMAGEYNVTFNIGNGYPALVSIVAPEYTKAETTPVKATVEAGKKNHFDFKVKKP